MATSSFGKKFVFHLTPEGSREFERKLEVPEYVKTPTLMPTPEDRQAVLNRMALLIKKAAASHSG